MNPVASKIEMQLSQEDSCDQQTAQITQNSSQPRLLELLLGLRVINDWVETVLLLKVVSFNQSHEI